MLKSQVEKLNKDANELDYYIIRQTKRGKTVSPLLKKKRDIIRATIEEIRDFYNLGHTHYYEVNNNYDGVFNWTG